MGNRAKTGGHGKQDYMTPVNFMQAVGQHWYCKFDLAASTSNICSMYFDEEDNSLEQNWAAVTEENGGYLWLNPPFGNTKDWVKKCSEEMERGAKIVSLLLASTGANWYRDYIHGKAMVYFLNGRVTFVGCKTPFPKDLMIVVWDKSINGTAWWDWRKDV